jgi:4-hydroxy-tetrahydrodipicolinate reductase
MRIALIGYGRMGREVEKAAIKRGHTIVLKIDKDNTSDFVTERLQSCEVAIEFSQSESAPTNIMKCIDAGVPVVSGTTGWLDSFEDVKNELERKNGSLLYASNFSIGVNILFRINSQLAGIMSGKSNFTPNIREIHHIHKKDSPSGTAITLADEIVNLTGMEGWSIDNRSSERIIHIDSVREGEVPGVHEINWRSEDDSIVLRHEAFSRSGFSNGAVLAAEFIIGKRGLFTMGDVLGF